MPLGGTPAGITPVGVPLAFAAGAVAARLLLQAAPPRWHSDVAQPLVVVTAWGPYGLGFSLIFALAIALATLALVVTLGPGRERGAGLSLPATLVVATFALAAIFAWPVVFSSDVYAYAAYGHTVVHGGDPYLPVARAHHDAFVDAARWQWGGTSFPPCVYGPAFVGIAALGVLAGGDRLEPSLWIMRIVASLAFLGSIALLHIVLRGKAHRRFAIAAYGLNPVALWSVAEGHNDALLVLVVFAAFAMLRRGDARASGALFGLAPLLKFTGAAAGPLTLVWLWGKRDVRSRRFALALAIGLVVTAALVLPLQLKLLGTFAGHARYVSQFSFQSLVGIVPALAVVVAAAVSGIRALARGDASGALWLAIAGWLAIPNPYPWYALWLLPVAVAFPPSRATIALWAATIFAGLRYLPEAFGNMPHLATTILTLALLAPIAFAIPPRVNDPMPVKATPAP
jgi:glycosyl transferase family 87